MLRNIICGRIEGIGAGVRSELNDILKTCLDCGECARSCPNGVKVDLLVVKYRAQEVKEMSAWERWLLENVFTSPSMVHSRFKQFKGIKNLSFLIPLQIVTHIRNSFPDVPNKTFSELLPPGIYEGKEPKKGKVLFFEGCVMGGLLSEKSRDSVLLLQKIGFDVVIKPQEGCCGALQFDRGDFELALSMAKRQLYSMNLEGIDFVVTDCAGCSKMLAGYSSLFFEALSDVEAALAQKAKELAKKTRHLVDLLPFEYTNHMNNKDTLFPRPCHYKPPLEAEVLEASKKLYKSRIGCCGGGGIFSLLQKNLSNKITLRFKEEMIKKGVKTVVPSSPSCYFTFKKALVSDIRVEYLSSYFLIP